MSAGSAGDEGRVRLVELGWVLTHADELPWDHHLCLPREQSWTAATPAGIYDADRCDDADDEPLQARRLGLRYALGMSAVQGVVGNLRARGRFDADALVDALEYYFEHDAFVGDEWVRERDAGPHR